MFDLYMFMNSEGESIWPQLRLEMLWKTDGGAGLGLTWQCCEEMDIADVLPLIEQAREQRKREADAVKRMTRKK